MEIIGKRQRIYRGSANGAYVHLVFFLFIIDMHSSLQSGVCYLVYIFAPFIYIFPPFFLFFFIYFLFIFFIFKERGEKRSKLMKIFS